MGNITFQVSVRITGENWRDSGTAELTFSGTEGVTLPALEKSTLDSLTKTAKAEFDRSVAKNRADAENG